MIQKAKLLRPPSIFVSRPAARGVAGARVMMKYVSWPADRQILLHNERRGRIAIKSRRPRANINKQSGSLRASWVSGAVGVLVG